MEWNWGDCARASTPHKSDFECLRTSHKIIMTRRKLDISSSELLPKNPPSYKEALPGAEQNLTQAQPKRPSLLATLSGSRAGTASQRSDTSKPKNVPYRSSKDLQAQIDRLGDLSQNLHWSPSNTRTEYIDILPSFQMYQSILKRNDFEFDEGQLGNPPVYGDPSSIPSPPLVQNPQSNVAPLLDSVSRNLQLLQIGDDNDGDDDDVDDDDDDEFEGRYLFSDNDLEEGLHLRSRLRERSHAASPMPDRSRSASRQSPHRALLTHEAYGHSVLDNIDMLPHAKSSPLSIEIYVTKDVARPHEPSDLETKLKEYSCGDVIYGYVMITNNLEQKVDFGLFTVSLECTIKAVHTKVDKNGIRPHTILQKKPLKMYDLNASYNEGAIPSSAGIQYEYLSKDQSDGCIIGLPNDRVLEPKTRYKKFIMFRFPDMLLDNSCPHGVLRHTMPPPSLGIDDTAFQKLAGSISLNKTLGYGVLNVRGTPIKVKDYCFDDISVSYTIEAKFIDKLHSRDQRHPVSPNDINDPENLLKYVVSKSSQFFLRFVPDVKAQVSTFSKAYNLFGLDTFDSVGIDGMLYGGIAKKVTWKYIDRMNLIIEHEIEAALDKQEYSADDMKRKNLALTTKLFKRAIEQNVATRLSHFLPPDWVARLQQSKVLFTSTSVDIFARKRKRFLPQSHKIGEFVLGVKVPDRLVPYGSPTLIQKYNDGRNNSISLLTSESKEDSDGLIPVMSNMLTLYNREDTTVIKSIELQLFFKNTDENIKPPQVLLVEFNIVAWTYKTDFPIPISFDHDFFYTDNHKSEVIIQIDDVENTKRNLQSLKDVVNHYIGFLKDTKTFISQNTYSYLKGLSKLGIKKDTIKSYYQSIQTGEDFDTEWAGEKLDYSTILWKKALQVPLILQNRNNATLPPSFQSCLVGRLYSLQVKIKLKGGDESQNVCSIDIPVLVG